MTTNRLHIFTHSTPVRWRDVDPFNVVNHSVFFTYMEEARWHWFYSLQLREELKIITPIVDAQISFKKPLTFPETIIIKIYAEPPADKSWSLYHAFYSAKEPNLLCAEATVKFVSYDPKTKSVTSIPEELKANLYPINNK